MTELEQLREDVKNRTAAVQTETAEKLEISRLTASLSILNNESFIASKVRLTLVEETTKKLKAIEAVCEEVVNSMAIQSAKTREKRKWNPSRQYGFNTQLSILTGILSGIQYSAQAHKEQMLTLTGLSEDLIEQTLEAFGSTAYYSKNCLQVIDETTYDMEALTGNIALIEEALSVKLDTSKLNNTVMRTRFEVTRIKAERECAEAETALVLSNQQTLKLDD